MSGKNISFDDKKIRKAHFIRTKKNNIEDIDANNIVVSKIEAYDTKNSLLDMMIMILLLLLCIKLPQTTGNVRKFNENTTMSFRVTDKQFLENYKKIWEKS